MSADDANDDYLRGCIDGMTKAADFIIAAPTLTHGQRHAVGGGFARVLDRAVDPDGDPDFVHNTYALRDAALAWLWQAVDAVKESSGRPSGPLQEDE